LEDWTILTDYSNGQEWVNKKTGVNVSIFESNNGWGVDIAKGGGRNLMVEKFFKDKEKAISYAKDYMRRN